MADAAAPSARTLAIAERQLVMLRELAELALGVSRAFAVSAAASAKAEETILGEEWFTPEVGRARACGAKDSAESFQKASRAVRLTLMLEKTTTEWLDDLESGAPRKRIVETPMVPLAASSLRRLDASSDRDQATDANTVHRESDRERMAEFDRPDGVPSALGETVNLISPDLGGTLNSEHSSVLLQPAFQETVDRICADLGAAGNPPFRAEAPPTRPPGSSEGWPPGSDQLHGPLDLEARLESLPP